MRSSASLSCCLSSSDISCKGLFAKNLSLEFLLVPPSILLLVCLLHELSSHVQGYFHVVMVIWILVKIILRVTQILLVILNVLSEVITVIIIVAFFLLLIPIGFAFNLYYTKRSVCKVFYYWVQSCGRTVNNPLSLLSDGGCLRFFCRCDWSSVQVNHYSCAIMHSTNSLRSCIATNTVGTVLTKVRFAQVS